MSKHLDRIVTHMRSGIPLEICGLLGGVGGMVMEVFPVPNISSEPTRGFLMEPQAQIDILLALEERNWDLVAIYHSHPPGARNDPSRTDVALACYFPDVLHVIVVPLADGRLASLRAFSINGECVSEVPIVLCALSSHCET